MILKIMESHKLNAVNFMDYLKTAYAKYKIF